MDWSLLPTDLVEKIGRHLPLPDYLRFGAACVSWRCATREKRYPPAANQLPWLVLCDEDDDKEIGKIRKRGFFNLTENRLYHLDIPEAYGKRFCGSTDGWLVTVDGDQQLHLLNPFSRAQIRLPPISTFRREPEEFDSDGEQDDRNYEPEYFRDVYIYKVLIFSSPSSANPSSDYVVVAIYGQFGKLAFYKAGDKVWTTIETPPYTRFSDIIRYKEELYAINGMGRIFVCDLLAPDPKATEFGAERLVHKPGKGRYLVESSGDLLEVVREVNFDAEDAHDTLKFDVFKLDVTNKKCEELRSLGDRILFVGHNSSVSLSSTDIPGAKGNLIYFTDDFLEYYLFCNHNTDLGVFNLTDGTVKPYYPPACHPGRSPPIWVTPNPWHGVTR